MGKVKYCVLLVLSILIFQINDAYSQLLAPNEILASSSSSLESNSLSESGQDTTLNQKDVKQNTSKIEYLPASQFMLADKQRYTIDASQPYLNTKIKPVEFGIFSGLMTGIFIAQHEAQQSTIWKRVGSFNVAEDGKFSAYLDKGGHFFGTFMPAYVFSEILMASGFSWDDATIIGGAMGMAYTTYVEMLDGFSKDWGFSPTDWYADVAGASFFIAQHYIPFLQNFTPKFMYVKPSWHREYDRKEAMSFIDNYSAQTFYMAINMHNILPESIKNYWPKWLDLSVGYAVYSLSAGVTEHNAELISEDSHFGKVYGNQKLLISLDYNLIELLPDGPGWWNWFKQSLNYFKFPSPTLEIGRDTKFFLAYPFFLQIGSFRF
jgi:hypothetical protein